MKIDRYEVMHREDGSIHRLGHGTTSSSYKALDLDLRVPVVLKVIREEFLEDETARKRFLREARSAALLRHPNVAMIHRLGEDDGVSFYAREFIEGETAESLVKGDGPLPVEQALDVALQVARALAAVKKVNLVHRDIKPGNLMMTPDGVVKIIDFGLARSNPGGTASSVEVVTLAGFVGTPDYASPEQLNEQEVDVSSDIYSLGVTLWFLLTGRPPFRGPMAQVMAQHLQSPPPFEELSALPRPLVGLLAHMLEKDPTRRPVTPALLIEEIDNCLANLKGSKIATPLVPVPMAPAAQVGFPMMSASREPVSDHSRRSVLADGLVGAAIAMIVYFVLSRPVEPAPPGPIETGQPQIERPVATQGVVPNTLSR